MIKPPYGNPTAWHLDNPYWSFYSRDAISIWVALERATLANGCMWYLPGTHKQARYDNAGIGENMRDLFKFYPEWQNLQRRAGAGARRQRRVPQRAGRPRGRREHDARAPARP